MSLRMSEFSDDSRPALHSVSLGTSWSDNVHKTLYNRLSAIIRVRRSSAAQEPVFLTCLGHGPVGIALQPVAVQEFALSIPRQYNIP